MDPLSQGSLGASLAQSSATREQVKAATLLGVLGGIAPDVDVFFRSSIDPLLFLEFHRQFTHALIFIPVGALVCACLAWPLARRQLTFKLTYLYCLLGYATHGLLDTCTTYGTQLLWPFTTQRFAWNNVSIIDPLFTLPILALIIVGVTRANPRFAQAAFTWAVVYLAAGLVQRDRAAEVGLALAASRGHDPVRLEAKPGFANLLLWKIVYETEDRFYVDAVRVGLSTRTFEGESIAKLNLPEHFPWLDGNTQQARDVERFRWFSNDYLAVDETDPYKIIDIRYSVLPNEINALWSIRLDPEAPADSHVGYAAHRETTPETLKTFRTMLFN